MYALATTPAEASTSSAVAEFSQMFADLFFSRVFHDGSSSRWCSSIEAYFCSVVGLFNLACTKSLVWGLRGSKVEMWKREEKEKRISKTISWVLVVDASEWSGGDFFWVQ